MKIRVILQIFILTLISNTLNAQTDSLKFKEYFLISKYNDTVSFYGKNQHVANLEYGFQIFDKDGKRTLHRVIPDKYKYLFFYDYNRRINKY